MRVNDLFQPKTPDHPVVDVYERERLRHITLKLEAMVHRDGWAANEHHWAQALLRRAYIAERNDPEVTM